MGSIITVATSKGGGGKSALCVVLSAKLAALGYRVAVVDADRNATFSSWHRANYEGPSIDCVSEIRHVEVVEAAQQLAEQHDVVLVDTAGFENLTAATAIATSDYVLIPCMPDRGSIVEAIKTAAQVTSAAKAARRPIPASVVRTRWNPKGLAERAGLSDLTAARLPVMRQHLSPLSEFGKMTFSGVVPITGTIGRQAVGLIDELVERDAIPARRARQARETV